MPPTKKDQTKINKIVVVDDHPMVRERLAEVINREVDLTVCGEAESRQQALAVIEVTRPRMVIVDLSLKDSLGLELIKDLQVRHPRLMVLVVSMHDESIYAERCLRAGARGYITKQEASHNVLSAIRKVLGGEVFLSESIAQKVLHQFAGHSAAAAVAPTKQLSDRELEVLNLLGGGFSTKQIAERLCVDFKTVDTYRTRIKDKLNLEDANELLQYAIRWKHSGGGV